MAARFDYEANVGRLGDAPRFRLLSDEKLARLHGASAWILEEIGVKVTTRPALDLLAAAGCPIDGGVVRIPREVVESAIASAPSEIVVYDRSGHEALFLGEKNVHFGLGITGIYFLDPETGEERDFTLEDFAVSCRVADALPNTDMIGTPGVLRATPEIPQEIVNHHEFAAMVANTTKPLAVLVENGPILRDVFEMASVAVGGQANLRARPFIIPYLNCVSPLIYNVETVDKLLLSADWGIPVLCIPSGQCGATGPVTLAGSIALSNAETLAGLVIHQLKRPGAPFIMGSDPAIMDMRTGNIAYATPETSLLMMGAAELAHYYGLPVTGLSNTSESKRPDQQMSLEQAIGAYGVLLSGVHLLPYMGFLESGRIFSLEALVTADEIVGMLRRIFRGVPVDDDTLALETIRHVGIGGQYLGEPHTLTHFREELWQPSVLTRETHHAWETRGRKATGERVKAKLREILETHQPEPLSAEAEAEIGRIIDERRNSLALAGAESA
ncbi:MAG: trimethylamine methyltransferase family protein [Thermoleophilia bacterium]|nr:trimethylamine methyltransferase family protein [Thermoleophilia bacterium]